MTQWLLTFARVGLVHWVLKGHHRTNSNLSVKSGSWEKKVIESA